MSKSEPAKSSESREQMERLRKNLLVLRNSPDVYNRCLILLDQSETALTDAIMSNDMNEKKAGIVVIVCLVDISSGEETTRVTKFARNLLKMLTNSDESVMRLASRAIAYLIQTSRTYAVELVELALVQCSEWLEEPQRNEQRRLAAAILSRDLALFTASHFFQRATHFFNHIFKVIRDQKHNLRVAATQALHAALAVTSQRETKQKNEWYKRCFDEACVRADHLSKDDALHSSLLIFNELLRIANSEAERVRIKVLSIPTAARTRTVIGLNPVEWLTEQTYPATVESRTAKSLVTEHYFVEIVNRCMEARPSRSPQCQAVILEIFPRLLGVSRTCTPPLAEMADHALHMTAKYPQALLTLGLLALNKPDQLKPKLPAFITTFHNMVQQSVSRRKPIDVMVFKGLALLVRSYPTSLVEKMRDLLPLLFATSLSKGLTEVLHEIVNSMPQLKTEVLDGLMEQLYHLLMNRAPPSKLAAPTAPPTPSGPIQVSDVRLTKLALDTLGEFEFQRHSLQMFMRYIAQGYLVCDAVEIRLAAVYCCAEITKPFVKLYENVELSQKKEIHALIKNVLECLIKTAVVDSEVEVRLAVLKCFCKTDNEFLYHLAQKEMLDMLFMTLYDENYQMQEAAVGLLGRLSDINPAFVFPRLRRIVLENISQLVNSRTPRFEEHSAKIIARLAIQCPSFVSPYMNSVLSALIPHLRVDKKNVDVTVHVLNALSELSLIGGLDIVRSINDLFPPLIAYLQDSTSLNRREAALRAMGGLCQSSAYVVDPYRDYPGLLDILLRLLKTELSVSMRRLTMKVLGIIGALDPYSHKVFLGTVHSAASKSLALSLPITNEKDGKHDGSDIIQWINYERCTLTEFYPAIAIANMVAMLQDEALSHLHKEIVEALLRIFGSLGSNSGQYVDQVVPRLITITETCKPEFRPFFLRQFALFASIVRLHLKPYMKRIFELIAKAWYWRDDAAFRAVVINVLEEVGKAFGTDFSPYITDLCPYLLTVVQADNAKDKTLTSQALQCVKSIAMSLGAHIHLILPTLLDVVDDKQVPEKVRLLAVDTIVALASYHRIAERAPTIMQSWLRCIAIKSMQDKLMALLLILMNQMWEQFLVYKESVQLALGRCKIDHDLRKSFSEQLLRIQSGTPHSASSGMALSNNRRIPNINELSGSSRSLSKNTAIGREYRHLINVDQLRTFWTAQSLTSREDWLQWLRTLRTQFIKQSPSAALRACASLADMHEPLAKELFNAAFMSVWTVIRSPEQDELTAQLVDVLTLCPHAEPIQAILNLAEFMDHSEKGPLPVNYKMLSKCAEQTRAYAKALRYKELDVLYAEGGEPTAEDCQALITFANKLNLEEESAGVVKYAEKRQMEISGRWYEKLGEWEKALDMYKTENTDDAEQQQSDELVLHQMRCLEALGRWSELAALGKQTLSDDAPALPAGAEHDKRQRIIQMTGRGCWALDDYDGLAKYVEKVNENSQEGSFLRAALAIRNENYKEATTYINKVRDMFDPELTAMAAESYERAYGAMVLVQQLTELEEAIEFKMMPERRMRIAVIWSRRLQGCRKDIEQWQRILIVRTLVLSTNELRPLWIKFSAMCRKQGKMSMATRVLKSLLEVPQDTALEKTQIPMDKPHLALAVCKHLWEEGKKPVAFNNLEKLSSTLHRLIECNRQTLSREQLESMARVTAKCYLKLGEWHSANNPPAARHPAGITQGGIGRHPNAKSAQELLQQAAQPVPNLEQATKVLLQYYINATNFDPTWYKAWHKLATMYYNLVMSDRNASLGSPVPSRPPSLPGAGYEMGPMTESSSSMALPPLGAPPPVSPVPLASIAANAAEAVYAVPSTAVGLGRPSPAPSPNAALYQQSPSKPQTPQPSLVSMYAINAIRCFLKAIQLAEGSRLEDTLRLLMLWFDYGDRQEIFDQLRDSLKVVPVESFLEVVPQLIARLDSAQNVGLLVKQVLLDIAKVHPQSLIYALTAATKSKNVQRSRVAREILQAVADMRPTFVEQAQILNDELIRCAILWHELWHEALEDASRYYFQTYFKELKDAREHCEAFERTNNQKEITQAWDLYYNVFKRISQQLRQMNSLDLNYIAPKLVKSENLELSVPGTYDPGSPLITIASIHHHLQVIMSKQRPRKVIMRGSDGKEYAFLLKGHEDPRQDERVMQLFGLINSLILRENDTCRRNLSIQRYSIIALSQSSGLIGWVPNCDTLHTLIRDYREKKKIPISEEHAKMQKLVIDIEKCTLLQKVEVFEEALRTTRGDDLRQTLWMKSPNSEVWFDRRTNYTRSMACMSMVGYILGLGDRHPSNLMLDRLSGKIVHIDFGDCFEVAMKREKYPEKIPFRLTRMLVQAMEVTGIEGNYRLTCERVLRLLRSNSDSILAVLEAFVYDPVLSWKLTDTTSKKPGTDVSASRESDAINRVKAKLSGRDFNPHYEITVPDQVNRLIEQATLYDNLCQCYIGWCPFW